MCSSLGDQGIMEPSVQVASTGRKRKRTGKFARVPLADVPVFLQSSELYQTLKDNEETEEAEVVEIPKTCFKENDNVSNSRDLIQLLETLRYWGVEHLPDSVYSYFTGPNQVPKLTREDLLRDFPRVASLQSMHSGRRDEWMAQVAKCGDIGLLKYLYERGYKWKGKECTEAARAGHLDCLQFAHEHGCFLCQPPNERYCCCQVAFFNGHLSCMRYAEQHGCCHVDLSFCVDNPWSCNNTSAECLELALERLGVGTACLHLVAPHAIRLRSAVCIDKLYDKGWRWQLALLRTDFPTWSDTTCRYTSRAVIDTGDIVLLEHVVRKGCPLQGDEADLIIARGRTGGLTLLLDRGQHLSAGSQRRLIKMGELQLLWYAIERGGCDTTTEATRIVTAIGDKDLLEAAFQHGYSATMMASREAARLGNLPLLQCAVQHGCAVDEQAGSAAAEGGHLGCLQFLYGHGAPLGKPAFHAAIRGGHLACLQFLHEQCGCPLTKTAVDLAIDCDATQCLRYMNDHGCPVWEDREGECVKGCQGGACGVPKVQE